MKKLLCLLFPVLLSLSSSAQGTGYNPFNPYHTAIPFFLTNPYAGATALGNAGAANSGNSGNSFLNPASRVFNESQAGVSLSYLPWFRAYVPDLTLYAGSAFWKTGKNCWGLSLTDIRYGLGIYSEIAYFQNNGYVAYAYKDNSQELMLNFSCARQLSPDWSAGISGSYIYSNLFAAPNPAGTNTLPVSALSGGLSLFYHKEINLFRNSWQAALGANFSDIGPAMSYGFYDQQRPLPANLRIGGLISKDMGSHRITLLGDINKLFVSPPGPAPASFERELAGLALSAGLEYQYRQHLILRTGYFLDQPIRGSEFRQNYTIGIGLHYFSASIDLTCIAAKNDRSPLQGTTNLTLSYYFSEKAKV
jgi:hypothetical protein